MLFSNPNFWAFLLFTSTFPGAGCDLSRTSRLLWLSGSKKNLLFLVLLSVVDDLGMPTLCFQNLLTVQRGCLHTRVLILLSSGTLVFALLPGSCNLLLFALFSTIPQQHFFVLSIFTPKQKWDAPDKWRLVWEIVNGRAGDRDLKNIDLRDANLNDANLAAADLSDANLTNAQLRSARLNNTNLENANLENANLRRVAAPVPTSRVQTCGEPKWKELT